MSRPIADAEQRARALRPDGSFIVQAPAGSGKTELLIQRFLSLLAQVDHPESVLAITFTIKATGEMRDRVIKALRSAAGPAPQEDHKKQTWDLARAVFQRDGECGWRLLENPSRLRIQTMDALCASIARQMPWLSRFGGLPRIEEKAEPRYREAARETLELLETDDPAYEHLAILLQHLDNNFAEMERLLAGMLAKRDQWLRHVVESASSPEIKDRMEQTLRLVVEEALANTLRALPESSIPAVLLWGEREKLPGTNVSDLSGWQKIADGLLRKGSTLTMKTRPGRDPSLGLDADHPFIRRLHGLRRLPPLSFENGQWQVLEALLRLLPVAAAQLKLIFQKNNVSDFQEVATAARTALGTREEPTDLAFALDYRIRHVLVDEFQDTSYSQYELIRMLTADWQPGDGRTVFVVGDPMQSIYLFRDADVGLFLRAREEGIGSLRLTPLRLETNFRSEGGLIAWVNDAFGAAFAETEDIVTGAVSYAPLRAFHPPGAGPAVHVHPFFEGQTDLEAQKVVDLVLSEQQRDPKQTIAILVQARTHLIDVLPLLRRAGLRFRAVEIDKLGTRPVVQDLLSLTRALLHLADRRSWLAILRAPWCGLTLADLHTIAGDDPVATIWELLNSDLRIQALTPDGKPRLQRFKEVLALALARQGKLPLRRWVEETWIALGGPACLEDKTSIEDARTYLGLLDSAAWADQLADLAAFEDTVGDLFGQPDVEAPDTLHVMTIHKAKGLEFDTVIVPRLGEKTREEERRLLLWLEKVGPEGDPELLLAPIHETGAEKDPVYGYLRWVGREKERHEDTRLLYVAVTRARRQLHLLGQVGVKKGIVSRRSNTLLHKIWDTVGGAFQAALDAQRAARTAPSVVPVKGDSGVLLRRLPDGWRMPEPPADVQWRPTGPDSDLRLEERLITFEWVSGMQRHVGTVVHAMLQVLSASPSAAFDRGVARVRLAAEGVPPSKLDEAVERVEAAIEATLSDERGRWILSAHDDSRSEFPLSGLLDGEMRHFVIDRTFVDENGVRWIIDYKTSSHEGGQLDAFLDNERERYQEQLEHYAALMRRLDDREIRLGLYFPLLGGWREWAFGSQQSFGFAAR